MGTCTFALIRATLSNRRASVVVNVWKGGWGGGGVVSERKSMEAGFSNEVAILNFLCEHVFTNEVAILNGRKVWFRESKVEIEQLECNANILSQVQNKASVYRFRSFLNIPHFFSQLCCWVTESTTIV